MSECGVKRADDGTATVLLTQNVTKIIDRARLHADEEFGRFVYEAVKERAERLRKEREERKHE